MVEAVVAASVYVANQLARGSPLGRQVLYYTALQSYNLGRKSEDPLSPAYIPSLFSFTTSPKKRRTGAWQLPSGSVKVVAGRRSLQVVCGER